MTHAKAEWVDFKDIKGRVSIVQILERYGDLPSLSKSGNGDRLSGACPIHGGTNKTHFRASISKNCWNCFGKCQCGGNIIDFVSKKENVSFRDAALLICKWFPVGASVHSEQSAHLKGRGALICSFHMCAREFPEFPGVRSPTL